MRRLILLPLLFFGLAHAAPPEAPPADLPDAATVARLLAAYPPVAAARAGVRLEEANRRRLMAGSHETTLRLATQERDVRTTPAARYAEWDVGIERAFRLPGKAALDAELGEAGVAGARLALGDALHEAARTLLARWFAWLRERAQAALWREQVGLFADELTVVEKRIRAGDAPRAERLAAEAALAQAEAGLAQARYREQAAATELMRRFPGLVLPQTVEIAEPRPVEGEAAAWRAQVLEHSHELAAARAESQRARLALLRADAERTPDPSVGLRVARERGGEERLVGLSLSIPFGGEARAAAVTAAQAQADMAASREAAVTRKLEAEAENLFHAAVAAHAAALGAREAARRLAAAADLAARAYALGEGSLNEVLAARRLALDARINATTTALEANEARYRLLLDAHRLWPIDPDEHGHE